MSAPAVHAHSTTTATTTATTTGTTTGTGAGGGAATGAVVLHDVGQPQDTTALRQVMSLFPSGVAAISAVVDGRPLVLVVSSFQVGISLDPPLVLFAVQRTSSTWPRLRQSPRLGVSILAEHHDQAAARLASTADRDQRLAALPTTTTAAGAHLIDDATAWMDVSVHSQTPAGDHDLVLLRVHAAGAGAAANARPLVWHRSSFHALATRTRPDLT